MEGLENFEDISRSLQPITLAEMDSVALMNRTDTKFMLDRGSALDMLGEIAHGFRILEVNGVRLNRYKTLYYDTEDLRFFRLHLNGKLNRYKVRNRKYVESDLSFLEVKFKSNKSRTIKERVVIDDIELHPSPDSQAFITDASGLELDLKPQLWSHFTRMTLVHNELPERLTIDTDLRFSTQTDEVAFDNMCIVELKQERLNRQSPFFRAAKARGIRPSGVSKYCLGIASLRDDLKLNALKPKLKLVQKIQAHVVE